MSREPELYAMASVLSVLSVLGIVGNFLVLYVFSRPARHDRKTTGATSAVRPSASATVYVMTLAVADLVTCLLDIPSTVYMEWVDFRISCDVFCKFYQVKFSTSQYWTWSNSLSAISSLSCTLAITWPAVDQFQYFFHCRILR